MPETFKLRKYLDKYSRTGNIFSNIKSIVRAGAMESKLKNKNRLMASGIPVPWSCPSSHESISAFGGL